MAAPKLECPQSDGIFGMSRFAEMLDALLESFADMSQGDENVRIVVRQSIYSLDSSGGALALKATGPTYVVLTLDTSQSASMLLCFVFVPALLTFT